MLFYVLYTCLKTYDSAIVNKKQNYLNLLRTMAIYFGAP